MPTDAEVSRLVRVYETYQASEELQTQWSYDNPGNRAILQERHRALKKLLARKGLLPLHGLSVLEIGCGSGNVLASLMRLGAQAEDLHGIDLIAERIACAKEQYPGIDFRTLNAECLEFPDAHFDLVLLFTVFSSILDRQMAHNVAENIKRVLKVGGAVIWYDFRFNNPRNPHVHGMTRRSISAMFPGFDLQLRTVTLLPPLARQLGYVTRPLYPLLASVPMLRTHYMGLLVKR